MHFATVWESIADAIPDLPAVTHGPTTRSWADYDERAARVAGALGAAGLGPGAKVSLFMYNSNEFMESQFGVFKVRGVPINVKLSVSRRRALVSSTTPTPRRSSSTRHWAIGWHASPSACRRSNC